nr:MAG TPA: hypothetical protein [Bacteriophage sp.]
MYTIQYITNSSLKSFSIFFTHTITISFHKLR